MFGMGTGGPSPLSTPTYFLLKKKVSKEHSGYSLLTAFFKEALDIVNQIARFVKGNFTLRIQTPSETGRGIKPEARIQGELVPPGRHIGRTQSDPLFPQKQYVSLVTRRRVELLFAA